MTVPHDNNNHLTPSSQTGLSVDAWGVAVHFGAAITATAEILEDVESIGHGHGMIMLVGSRLCRELNLLRESVAGQLEACSCSVGAAVSKRQKRVMFLRVQHAVLKALSWRPLVLGLSVAALGAALLEVVEDVAPGGHHGAVLLATHELIELSEAALHRTLFHHRFFRLSLISGATILAAWEMIREGSKLAGHHGVFLLAVSRLLRVLGQLRFQIGEKEE